MDNIDSKPQQTGGLKLMTVFIAVLALHVLVIGGFTVYHLMSAGSNDADFALDKTHKMKPDGTILSDTSAATDAGADKTSAPTPADATGAATSTAAPSTASTTPSSTAGETASTGTTTPSPTPAPAVAANPPAPAPPAPAPAAHTGSSALPAIVITGADLAKVSPIAPGLAPPPEPTRNDNAASVPAPVADAAPAISSAAVPTGPVHMPAVAPHAAPAIASAAESSVPAATTHRETYTVKITDSFKKIAHAHHVSVAQLKEANHIKGDMLHTGQKLIIPSGKTLVARSETALELEAPGKSTTILSADAPSHASSHRHVYTVARGDTLKKIAKRFNVSATSIRDANNLGGDKLSVGRKLKIPAKEARSAGVSEPVSAPSQVETEPAPVAEPAPMEPAPASPSPAGSPELANMTF